MPTTSPLRLNSGPPELPIDRHIGLDEGNVLLAAVVSAANCADDAVGDRVIHAKRRADRDYPLTGSQLGRISNADHRQAARVDLEQGNIGLFVGANDLCIQFATIGKSYGDLIRTIHHMIVGENVAVRRNYEA